MFNKSFNQFTILMRKSLDFYSKNGFTNTLARFRHKLISKIRYQKYTYQTILKRFPERFYNTQKASAQPDDWLASIDLSAQSILQEITSRLHIPGSAVDMLSRLRAEFDDDRYYRILDDLFTFDRTTLTLQERPTAALLYTSALPELPDPPRKRKILFITAMFPSLFHGGGNHVRYFIKILSEDNDIYLVTSHSPEDGAEAMQAVAPYCRSIYKIPDWRFGGNQAEIQRWLNGMRMDVIHYEWPGSLKNYDPGYGDLHIFTYMESISLRTFMDMQSIAPLSAAWVNKLAELIHNVRLELSDTAKLDARIAVTTKDGEFFRRLQPNQQYAVLNHGVTFSEYSLADVPPEPFTLVFSGNYAHYPNTDATNFFFNEIWGGVCKEIPSARIYLVGADPSHYLARFADGQRVIVTGAVPDVRPYIQKASICVAPLISGAGIRVKVIEYAALRRTFVATSIATTDLAFKDGVDYLLADTAFEFTQKIVMLLKDQRLAASMGKSVHETARRFYDNHSLVNYQTRYYDHLEKSK
jgi:glycosyltransferase involved in cell wall biosynthesis